MIISISRSEINDCAAFAFATVDHHYKRMQGQQDRKEGIRRIRAGKICEVDFYHYLESIGISYDLARIFEIQDGPEEFDFQLGMRWFDVKAGWQANHRCLVVNKRQFYGQVFTDYYIGVLWSESNHAAQVMGYATRSEVATFTVSNLKEDPAYYREYNAIHNTNELKEICNASYKDHICQNVS